MVSRAGRSPQCPWCLEGVPKVSRCPGGFFVVSRVSLVLMGVPMAWWGQGTRSQGLGGQQGVAQALCCLLVLKETWSTRSPRR